LISNEKFSTPLAAPAPGTPDPGLDSDPFDISLLSVPELLALRDRVMAALPASSLKEMNLEQEVVLMFLSTRALLHSVLESGEATPANQKAQVANTCAANLQQLVKMQLDLYTSERVKAIEIALGRTLKSLPEETQVSFINEYERMYAAVAPQNFKPVASVELTG